MADPIRMIVDDHAKLKELQQQFLSADHARLQAEIFKEAKQNLEVHDAVETQIVYPEYLALCQDQSALDHYNQEHADIRRRLQQLDAMGGSDPSFREGVLQLFESAMHHALEEEARMLPRLDRELTPGRRLTLSEEMAEVRHKLGSAFDVDFLRP